MNLQDVGHHLIHDALRRLLDVSGSHTEDLVRAQFVDDFAECCGVCFKLGVGKSTSFFSLGRVSGGDFGFRERLGTVFLIEDGRRLRVEPLTEGDGLAFGVVGDGVGGFDLGGGENDVFGIRTFSNHNTVIPPLFFQPCD